jgi:serine/threonine-protein kinase
MNQTQMDKKTFLAHLQRSSLLSSPELEALRGRMPRTERGRVIARALVEWGLLTKFQAELLLAGRTSGFILGQYRILDEIGQGGMGRVFKAIHQTMNRVVALKILAPQLTRTVKAQRLFQREAQAAARLIHPNIVTAYDANHAGDRHYLVMEYVDGPNLEQLVRERGPLPVGLACDVIRQVAHGLQFAFEMGMVHRDIKPANVLLQGPQAVVAKITDFGLARMSETEHDNRPGTILTKPNVVMGTPDYLSPEQSRSLHKVDIRSDLYSLGCTFYYLLTGKVPFRGGTSMEKLIRHSTEEAAAVEKLRPDLGPEVAFIVRKLMSKDVADRFQSPLELAEVLAPFAASGPLPAGTKERHPTARATGPTGSDAALPDRSRGDPFATVLPDDLVYTVGIGHSPTPTSAQSMPRVPPQSSGSRPIKIATWLVLTIIVLALGFAIWLCLR